MKTLRILAISETRPPRRNARHCILASTRPRARALSRAWLSLGASSRRRVATRPTIVAQNERCVFLVKAGKQGHTQLGSRDTRFRRTIPISRHRAPAWLWPTRLLPAANPGWVRSSPLVQHLNLISGRNRRGFQIGDRGCNPPIGQVVTRVVVEADDQNPGMRARRSHDQVMELSAQRRAETCRRDLPT